MIFGVLKQEIDRRRDGNQVTTKHGDHHKEENERKDRNCKNWEKETKWDEQEEHDKQIRADAYELGRKDAKKEINEIMDMDVPISNVLYEIDKWLKEKKNE